jgi:ferredoxin--NADP+ reductase
MKMIVPNVFEMTVESPYIASKVQPGQFVIIKSDDTAERIPFSVADWDAEKGTVTCVFLQVGFSTAKLARFKPGDTLEAFVGPLGQPTELGNFGHVVCAGGCYGIGAIHPIARALREMGNKVTCIIEARSSFLLYWEDKMRKACDKLVIATDDGSAPYKGDARDYIAEEMIAKGEHIDRIFAVGCTFMMYDMAQRTRESGIKTIVSLNPIMIDGTGMCGACRVVVGGEIKFACVDGPDFDAHQIDWDTVLARRKPYLRQEATSVHLDL